MMRRHIAWRDRNRAWCADSKRRKRAQIPDGVQFKTKTELGTAMITGAIGAGTRFAWVAGDEAYGRASKLRAACEQAGKGYVLAVPSNVMVPCRPGARRLSPRWPG